MFTCPGCALDSSWSQNGCSCLTRMCMTNADQGNWRLNNDFLDAEAGDVQKKNLWFRESSCLLHWRGTLATIREERAERFQREKKENVLPNAPLLSPPPPPPPLSNCFSEVQRGHKFRGKANLKQTNQLGRWRRGIKICVFYASGERELLTGGYWRRRNGLLYDVSTPIPSLKEILPIIACTGRLRWKGAPCSGFR